MTDKKGKHVIRRVISTVLSGDNESSAFNRISRKLKQHIQHIGHQDDDACKESHPGTFPQKPLSMAGIAGSPSSVSHLDGFRANPPPRAYAVYPPRVTFEVLGYISDGMRDIKQK